MANYIEKSVCKFHQFPDADPITISIEWCDYLVPASYTTIFRVLKSALLLNLQQCHMRVGFYSVSDKNIFPVKVSGCDDLYGNLKGAINHILPTNFILGHKSPIKMLPRLLLFMQTSKLSDPLLPGTLIYILSS